MNIKVLQKHVDNTYYVDINMELLSDGSNKSGFYCPDVVGGRKFVQNYGGYPRSEIAEINALQNMQEQMSLLQNLQDYSPQSNPNAGKTDAEIMLGHRSKYCQTASEMIDWLDYQLQSRANEREASSQIGDVIDFSSTENPPENA